MVNLELIIEAFKFEYGDVDIIVPYMVWQFMPTVWNVKIKSAKRKK